MSFLDLAIYHYTQYRLTNNYEHRAQFKKYMRAFRYQESLKYSVKLKELLG